MTEARIVSPHTYSDLALHEQVRTLREAAGSKDLFPEKIDTLQPEMVQAIDHRALLLLGHIGVDHAFKTLDDWLRFPRREEAMLREELAEDPNSVNTAVQMAGRYVMRLRFDELEPRTSETPEERAHDPNYHIYNRFQVYKSAVSDMQLNPQERLHSDRVRVARLSIRAAALFRKELAK